MRRGFEREYRARVSNYILAVRGKRNTQVRSPSMQQSLTVHPMPVRNLQLPKLWYENNPVKTHFFNALSTLFPQGENYFIWSIKNFADQARSEPLKKQIEDFITQEKNHAALHKAYNRCLSQ